MTHDLLHGDLPASINDNLFLLIGLPALAGWLLMRRRRGQRSLPMPAVVMIAVATIAWTVVRNLPGFPLVPTILSGYRPADAEVSTVGISRAAQMRGYLRVTPITTSTTMVSWRE